MLLGVCEHTRKSRLGERECGLLLDVHERETQIDDRKHELLREERGSETRMGSASARYRVDDDVVVWYAA